MTFTFKLARRLAQSHLVIFALSFLSGSCAPGKPLEGGFEPPPDDVLAIHLFPDSVSLNPSEFIDFTAIAELESGANGSVGVTWQAQGGTISSAGRFTAGSSAGVFRVIGQYQNGPADTATVVVTVVTPPTPVLTRINVAPGAVALLPDGSQQFSATGQMSDGSSSAVAVNWSTTGGIIDGNGSYSAPSVAGTYLVVASQQGGSLSDTAQVSVTIPPPTLAAVILTPASASLEFGQTRQFSAVGQLSDGSSTSLAVTWTATGGTVNSNGLYTAGNTAGSFRVIARSANGLADTSSITLAAPTITAITLTPASVSLQSGQTQQFNVSASLSNGGTQSNPSVTWFATGGAINGSGLFTAGASAGTFQVIATSANGKADTSSVSVSFPTITAISVTPASVTLGGGQTQQFSASATLSNGGTQAGPSVTWSATGGSVSTSGLYTAGTTAGGFRVIAVSTNGRADTSAVTISAATISSITMTPATVSLQTGATQQFTLSAQMSDGSTLPNPSATYSATGGTVSTSGLYTAGGTAGTFRVIATASGKADTSAITVTPLTISSISMTPATVSLAIAATQQFSVSATMSDGSTQSNPSVTYSATGGTVSTGGLYTAGGTAGTFRVIASASGKADTSAITITAATISSISMTPATVSLAIAATQQFSVSATMSDGSTQSNPAVTYSATGGTVSTGGLYTAGGTAGTFRVIASASGKADTSAITITAATISSISMTPATVTLASAETQQFSVSATMSDGSTQSNPAVTWTATGGVVSTGGFYVAGTTAGSFRVIATASGKADTSDVTITAVTISSISMTPATVTLASAATQQLSVSATMSDGSTQSNPSVTYSATGGTVSTGGLYTAGATAGTFRVIATASGKADTSAITITAATITDLTVTPATLSLQTGGTQQFSVSATLSTGGTQSNPTVTWTATGGVVSTGGFYVAGASAGSFLVIATATGGVADTSTVTITAATITAIVTTPGSVNLAINQSQQFSASATMSNGSSQPNTSVTWSATGGSISSGGMYSAGGSTGTFRVIAVQQGGGLADTSAITISATQANSMFFNSAEAGCDGSDPNVVLCDDFEDGEWYSKNCDQARASGGLQQTDGWCGTIYANSYIPQSAQCGGAGAAGSNCTAYSGVLPGPNSDNTGNMGDHNLGPNNSTYGELYFRYYIKYSTDHSLNPQKTLTINSTDAGSGGISIAGWGNGAGWASMCPVTDCNGSLNNSQNTGCPGAANYYLCQNQGANLSFSSVLGHWVYVEIHVKMNSAGSANGVYELWMNDCGSSGVCSGSPILRARFTNVRWSTDGRQIKSFWIENQSPPPPDGPSRGQEWYDQIKVSKVPVGFVQ